MNRTEFIQKVEENWITEWYSDRTRGSGIKTDILAPVLVDERLKHSNELKSWKSSRNPGREYSCFAHSPDIYDRPTQPQPPIFSPASFWNTYHGTFPGDLWATILLSIPHASCWSCCFPNYSGSALHILVILSYSYTGLILLFGSRICFGL